MNSPFSTQFLLCLLALFIFTSFSNAATLEGRVVAVADGDNALKHKVVT